MDPTDIEVAGLAMMHKAPLGADSIPDKNQSHHCFSCEAPINGLYCDVCGQKNDNFRRSIFSLLKELIGSVTGLESRIWRTWFALLFKPGKVAREFADGARTRWSSPVRSFLAMSIILFGYMSFTGTQLISVELYPTAKDGVTKPADQLAPEDVELDGGIFFFKTRKEIDAQNKTRDYDLLERKLLDDDGKKYHLNIGPTSVRQTEITDEVTAETEDDEPLESDTDKSIQGNSITVNGEEIDYSQGVKRFLGVVQDPRELNAVFYTWLPRIMFLMMPFSMFIGALFIRGRGNALLYDHLVHAAYIHAVVYFLSFIGIIASRQIHGAPIALIIFLFMLFYLPLSLKNMFSRGWFKTVWTAYGVGFIYFTTILIMLMFLLGVGVASSLT